MNPFQIKVTVSTGPTRLKFFAGSVAELKNKWKSMGVHIVSRNEANYVIVPDGTQNIGKIDATPIFYSDFVSLLDDFSRPKSAPCRMSPDKSLKSMIHFTERGVQTLIADIFNNEQVFYYQTYYPKFELLKMELVMMKHLIQHWDELRMKITPIWSDLPRSLMIHEHPCDLKENDTVSVKHLEGPSSMWLSEAWDHYRKTFQPEKQNLLALVEDVIVDDFLKTYFWQIETDLRLMYASMLCALEELNSSYFQWAKNVRTNFTHGSERIFQDREKPIIFVLDELITAFCVAEPKTKQEQESLFQIYTMVSELYRKWFGSLPKNAAPSCSPIREMYNMITQALKTLLHATGDEDILWSELPKVLDLKNYQWDNLFSADLEARQKVVAELERTVKGEKYQKLRDVVLQFSKIKHYEA